MATEGQTEGAARGLPSIGSILSLQKTLATALTDIRAIAEGMSYLPELARILASIEEKVETMGAEVSAMRAGVDSLNGKVDRMSDRVDGMAEPLGEVARTLHPLKRSASRIGRITRRGPDEEPEPASEDA